MVAAYSIFARCRNKGGRIAWVQLAGLVLSLLIVSHDTFAEPIGIHLSGPDSVIPATLAEIEFSISPADSSAIEYLGGFHLLIAYDSSLLTPWLIDDNGLVTDCGWEFFSFNLRHFNCAGCPNSAIDLLALADIGAADSGITCLQPGEQNLSIRFLVTNDVTHWGERAELSFVWSDCSDNIVWSKDSTAFGLATSVLTAAGIDLFDSTNVFPTSTGPRSECFWPIMIDSSGFSPLTCFNTAFTIIAPDSIGSIGDINLNGIAFEESDYDLLRLYFLFGDTVFHDNPAFQVRATDVNGDGADTGLVDLVAMRYRLLGDSTTVSSRRDSAYGEFFFEFGGDTVGITAVSDEPIGAWRAVFSASGSIVDSVRFQTFADPGPFGGQWWSQTSDTLRMLLVGGTQESAVINAGRSALATVHYSPLEMLPVTSEAISVDGKFLVPGLSTDIDVEQAKNDLLPGDFRLRQNYPNPFNPQTQIEFEIPGHSEWNLVILNSLGQQVRTFEGRSGSGETVVGWNGTDDYGQSVASGVYFYRLMVGGSSLERKMLLLK